MISSDIRSRIQAISIKTKRLMSGAVAGDFTTPRKGSGFEFVQLREYQEGDDVRFIDWKATAKTEKVFVRQYAEERNRTIWLVVDRSASLFYGSKERLKYEVIAEAATLIACAAEYQKDSVGLIFFDETATVVVPPAQGRMHTQNIAEKIFEQRETAEQAKKTDFEALFNYLLQVTKKRSICFLFSDFQGCEQLAIQRANALHKQRTIGLIRIRDDYELEMPEGLLLQMEDVETGKRATVLSSDLKQGQHAYWRYQDTLLKQIRASVAELSSSRADSDVLVRFFKQSLK
jgi:uncharacterized protein (DUF58 family)